MQAYLYEDVMMTHKQVGKKCDTTNYILIFFIEIGVESTEKIIF